MSVLICPECGAENPPDLEKCWVCMSSLEGVSPIDSKPDEEALLPQSDEDLTELLHALRQDEDLSDFPAGKDEAIQPASLEDVDGEIGIDDEGEIPEWLDRIRQRAQTEADSVGEITQKLSAARESLDEAKKEHQRQQFENLIHKIHGEDDGKSSSDALDAEEQPEQNGMEETERADWLKRIRKKHRPAEPERPEEILSEREGDSLLHWLVALEDGVAETSKPVDTVDDTQEIDLTTTADEQTHETPVESRTAAQPKDMVLSISREEQARADQLAAVIMDENAPRPTREPGKVLFPRGLRLGMGLVLIALLSLALFFWEPGDLPSGNANPHSFAALEWAQGLPEKASLLLVLDYQAGFSSEITLVAQPILDEVLRDGREISILSSTPAGSLLFERLLEDAGLAGHLVVHDLGYYPVGSFGAYGLSHQVLSEWRIISQPEFSKALPTGVFDGILILGDDYEGAMAWVEQFSSLMPDTPMLLFVSAQAGPLLMPYWESGQVEGVVSGLSDAVNLNGQVEPLANRWRAYQVGVVLMILMLLIGMSLPVTLGHREEGGDR